MPWSVSNWDSGCCGVLTHISQGHRKDNKRKEEVCQSRIKWVLTEGREDGGKGKTQKEGFKRLSMWRNKPGINNMVSLVGLRRGEQVSGAWGQQTASFLPVRQHGDRKGHQRGSLGLRFASCQGPCGSSDNYIQVIERATCVIVSLCVQPPLDVDLNGSQVGDRRKGGLAWEQREWKPEGWGGIIYSRQTGNN